MATEKKEVEIIINGQKANASIKEMEQAFKVLSKQLKELPTGTEEWKKKQEQVIAQSKKLSIVKEEIKGVSSAMSNVKEDLGKANSGFLGLGKVAGGLGSVFKGAVSALLPLLAMSEVFSFLGESKKAFEESAAATAQLEASLKSTQGAAGVTKDEILELASNLQNKTLFGDEQTTGAASLLLTFTEIKKGVFEEALPAIQDMAQKMAGDGPADLKGATLQVGKALNDPIKGISALSKVGVSFTEQQKDTIKSMVAMGDKAGAQKLILAELNKEFGGSAEAARKAKGGMADFQVIMGELQETVGEGVMAGLNVLASFLGELFTKADPLIDVFKGVWNEMSNTFNEVSRLISGLFGLSDQGSIAESIINILTGAFNILLTPIKTVFSIVGSLVRGFIDLYNGSELVRSTIGALGSVISQVFTTIKDSAIRALGGVSELLIGIFTLDVDKIKSGLNETFGAVKDQVDGLTKGVIQQAKFGAAMGTLSYISPKSVEETKKNADQVVKKIEEVTDKTIKLTEKQIKEKEKLEKEAAEKAKKAEEDRLKAEELISQKRIALIKDEYEKREAEIKAAADKEIKSLVGTEEQKKQLVKLIRQQMWDDLDALEKANEDKKEKEREQREKEAKSKRKGELEGKISKAGDKIEDAEESGDTDGLIDAQMEKLGAERDLILENEQLTADERFKINEEYNNKIQELDNSRLQARIQHISAEANKHLQTASQLAAAIGGIQQAETDLKIANAEKVKAERIKKLDEELAAGRISQSVYDAEKQKADDEYNKKTEEIKKKQQKRNKRMAIVQALINTALGVTSALGGAWPLALVFAALAGVMGGLQVAAISKQPDSSFKDGGFTAKSPKVKFKKWSDVIDHFAVGGYTGGTQGSFKDGGWVRTRRIGEIGEAGSEYVSPHWMISSPKYADIFGYLESERQRKRFAEGGLTGPAPSIPSTGSSIGGTSGEVAILLRSIDNKLDTLNSNTVTQSNNINQWQREVKAVIPITDVDDGLNELYKIRGESVIK